MVYYYYYYYYYLQLYYAQQHDADDTTPRNSETQPPDTPSAQEAERDIQQLTPTPENNTHGLAEQMQNCNEVTQRCPQIYICGPQNTNSLRKTGNNTTHMAFECQLAVKLHAKDVKYCNSNYIFNYISRLIEKNVL